MKEIDELRLTTGTKYRADLGRHLLEAREMKADGKSDKEIEESLKSWRVENVC